MRVRRALRLAHLCVGVVLSVLLLVLALTGSALVYKEAYWRVANPELRGPAPELGPGDHARAVAYALTRYGTRLRSVKMPEPGVAAYHLYLEGGEAFVSAGGRAVIDEWRPRERAMAVLFDVHAHLMSGEGGERVGGVVALLGAFMVVSGVVLWWPARGRFHVSRLLLPRGGARRLLLHWHRDLGALAAPLVLLLLLTGGGIVFYDATGLLLNAVLGGPVAAHRAPPQPFPAPAGGPADADLLATAASVFPDARLVFYYPPTKAAPRHGFRLKQPCELHPNGRTYVYVDGGGDVLEATDACASAPGERTLHALYPLHAGKAGSAVYRALTFLGGIALAAVSLSGALAYLRGLRETSVTTRRP